MHVDFKNPACLRALTWALLKDDFQLDVQLPLDRLIPTIPLRLNYILWLEDIFGISCSALTGIDIGLYDTVFSVLNVSCFFQY